MSRLRITSADNPLVKRTRRLVGHARARREAGLVVLDGAHLLAAWLAAGRPIDYLMLSDRGSEVPEIRGLVAGLPESQIHRVSDGILAAISPVETPTGVLAIAAQPRPGKAPDSAADSLLLDGVQDPGNLGSILRSAAAVGWRQVLLSADCAQAWSPKALRAGMGAQLALDIHEGIDLAGFLATYAGLSLAAEPSGDESLFATELPPDTALAWVVGAEGQGVRTPVLDAVQRRVRIPMATDTESLNVGAAAVLCLYEGWRRRQG
jgi:TrmH family RNA methyltransferase